jgi:hypothetical protein
VDGIHLAQYKDKWAVHLNTKMYLQVPLKVGISNIYVTL